MDDFDNKNQIGVLGATSFVGACLLPLLTQSGWGVAAYSRRIVRQTDDGVEWRCLPADLSVSFELDAGRYLPLWICAAPIWVLPEYFALLEAYGVRRVVVLSSTSRFSKGDSSDLEEQALVRRLAESEACVQAWAESRGVEWVILRPTLIYGLGQDKNISEIARFIRRFGFFPLFGKANGLRQPIHAEDVAIACMAGMQLPYAANQAYNISGSETLSYRDMVVRIFEALGRPPCLLTVPLSVFRIALALLRCIPRYRHWSVAMAERMNKDLTFDHSEAVRQLGFNPRTFALKAADLPPS